MKIVQNLNLSIKITSHHKFAKQLSWNSDVQYSDLLQAPKWSFYLFFLIFSTFEKKTKKLTSVISSSDLTSISMLKSGISAADSIPKLQCDTIPNYRGGVIQNHNKLLKCPENRSQFLFVTFLTQPSSDWDEIILHGCVKLPLLFVELRLNTILLSFSYLLSFICTTCIEFILLTIAPQNQIKRTCSVVVFLIPLIIKVIILMFL